MDEQKVIKIIDEIFKKHGHIYDGLHWRDQLQKGKNVPMPQSLQNYFRRLF